jgi:hypothetical protein
VLVGWTKSSQPGAPAKELHYTIDTEKSAVLLGLDGYLFYNNE